MTAYVNGTALRHIVCDPPCLEYRTNDGRTAREYQTLVGFVAAPAEHGPLLALYGIDVRFAGFSPDVGRWESCLFSPQVADMLEALCAEGQFPYAFEAVPSQAEVVWLEAKIRGSRTRPALELRCYCLPASPESIEAIPEDEDRPRVRRGPASNEVDGDNAPGGSDP